MNPMLIFVREICLATWFGGLVVIDVIETPIRIRTREVTLQQATAIGGRVFTGFGWIQVVLGVISLAASILISQAKTFVVTAITVMLFISLIQSFFVAPKMLALRTQLYASGPSELCALPGRALTRALCPRNYRIVNLLTRNRTFLLFPVTTMNVKFKLSAAMKRLSQQRPRSRSRAVAQVGKQEIGSVIDEIETSSL